MDDDDLLPLLENLLLRAIQLLVLDFNQLELQLLPSPQQLQNQITAPPGGQPGEDNHWPRVLGFVVSCWRIVSLCRHACVDAVVPAVMDGKDCSQLTAVASLAAFSTGLRSCNTATQLWCNRAHGGLAHVHDAVVRDSGSANAVC